MKRHRGVLVAPCGAGKTVMGILLASLRAQRTLILVHTLDLAKQWQTQFQNLCGLEPGMIGAGKKEMDAPILVATVQSLIRDRTMMLRLSQSVGTVIIDECHHTPATTFTKVLSCFRPLNLYGLSATPIREDGLTPVMHSWIGKTLHRIFPEQLQMKKHLMRPGLKVIPTNFFYPFDPEDDKDYHKMIESLIEDKHRNELILDCLEKSKGISHLILSQRIRHCEILFSALKERNPDFACALITSQTDKKIRDELLGKARNGEIRFLFATQLADEGLDIPCLDSLWLVCPSRNISRIEQRVGRIMRTMDGKKKPVVYDFVDEQTKTLKNQFRTRMNMVYRRLLEI